MKARSWLIVAVLALLGCKSSPSEDDIAKPPTPPPPPVVGTTGQDNSAKQLPRLLPQEAYIRSYLLLFGGLSPIETQKVAQGNDGAAVFDMWSSYLTSLGMPDYFVDIPRATQTNTLMLGTFERMGNALCDRAVERDLQGKLAVDKRVVFAFDVPKGELDQAAFATRLDVLHRTFLGYPLKLAPASRLTGFFKLYSDIAHATPDAGGAPARFSTTEAGWAAVCYALVRHPEFHVY